MEHIVSLFQNFDTYGILATFLSAILTTVVPVLSYKYRKVLKILIELKRLISVILESWDDHEITKDEMKVILDNFNSVLKTIKEK